MTKMRRLRKARKATPQGCSRMLAHAPVHILKLIGPLLDTGAGRGVLLQTLRGIDHTQLTPTGIDRLHVGAEQWIAHVARTIFSDHALRNLGVQVHSKSELATRPPQRFPNDGQQSGAHELLLTDTGESHSAWSDLVETFDGRTRQAAWRHASNDIPAPGWIFVNQVRLAHEHVQRIGQQVIAKLQPTQDRRHPDLAQIVSP